MRGGNQATAELGGGRAASLVVVRDTPPADRDGYFGALQRLKARSALSYASLAQATDRPQSTIHGWVTGRHLPYARDNADFARVLELLGADEIERWMDTLFELRVNSAAEAYQSATDDGAVAVADLTGAPPTPTDATAFWHRRRAVDRLVSLIEQRLRSTPARGAATAPSSPVIVTGRSRSSRTTLLHAGLVTFDQHGHPIDAGRPRPAVQYARARHGVEWTSPVATNDARTGAAAPGRILVIDEFETLLAPASRQSLGSALDHVAHACGEPRTAVVIALHADHLGAAVEIPLLRGGIEDGVVVADAPIGSLADG